MKEKFISEKAEESGLSYCIIEHLYNTYYVKDPSLFNIKLKDLLLDGYESL